VGRSSPDWGDGGLRDGGKPHLKFRRRQEKTREGRRGVRLNGERGRGNSPDGEGIRGAVNTSCRVMLGVKKAGSGLEEPWPSSRPRELRKAGQGGMCQLPHFGC